MSQQYKMAPDKHYQIPNVRPNQKAIRVKRSKCNKENPYTTLNLMQLNATLFNLSGNAFKVWTWFCTNKEGYQFALSGTQVQQDCHISKGTYDRAIKELIDNGYLREALLFPKFRGYIFVEGGTAEPEYEEEIALQQFLQEGCINFQEGGAN